MASQTNICHQEFQLSRKIFERARYRIIDLNKINRKLLYNYWLSLIN